MEIKATCILTIVFIGFTNIVVSALRYEHISDCFFYNGNGHKVTLICDENNNENKVFASSDHTVCLNTIVMENYWPNIINFENCHFPTLNVNFFVLFPNTETFIIPGVDLQTLPIHIFSEGKSLKNLIASNNRLVEFPSRLFPNENQINHIDLSTIK